MSIPRLVIPIDWLDWCMGVEWPQGDEDGMRRIRDAWKQCAIDVLTAGGAGGDVTGLVNGAVNSASAEEFTAYWNKHVAAGGILDQLGQQCAATANYADMAATQIEATKISMNIVALLMYWEFVQAMIEIAATFGFGTPAVAAQLAAEEFATREALIMLAKSLLKAMEFTVLPDLVSEVWEAVEHHSMEFIDWSKLGHDFEHGLVLGAFFAIPGLGGQLAGKVPGLRGAVQFASEHNPFSANIITKTAGSLLYAGGANVAGNALTWAVDQGVQAAGVKDWAKDSPGPFANWQQAFVNGVFMSGVHTGAEGIKNHYGDPKLGVTTTDGTNLLLRTRGGSDIGGGAKTDGLYVFDHTDRTKEPVYQGRGSVNPETGQVTVSRDGVQTTHQGLVVHTLDSGRTLSTVSYDGGSADGGYRPASVTFHGGGDSGLPANHSVQYDPQTEQQTGIAVRGTGHPGSEPARDPLDVQVAPGSVHVFDSTSPEPARVSVAGGGGVTPAGFDRPITEHETAVYGYDGRLHEVHSYPGGDPHGLPPEQIPQPGFQAVYNPDGSFRGIEPQNPLLRPEPIADPALIAAAHQRAARGVIREAVPPDPGASDPGATDPAAGRPGHTSEPGRGTADQPAPAAPGARDTAADPAADADGPNLPDRVRPDRQQAPPAGRPARNEQLSLFESLLNGGGEHQTPAGRRADEQALIGAAALTDTAVATAYSGPEAARGSGRAGAGRGLRWNQDPIPGTVSPHAGPHDWNPRLGDRYHTERASLRHGVDENGQPYVRPEGSPERYPTVHAAAETMLRDFADHVRDQYGDLLAQPPNHIGRALADLYTGDGNLGPTLKHLLAGGHRDVHAAVKRIADAPAGTRRALAELLYNPPADIGRTLRQVLAGDVHDARALAEVLDWFENPTGRETGLHFPNRNVLNQHDRKMYDRVYRGDDRRFDDLLHFGIGTPEQTRAALRHLLSSGPAERRGFHEMLDSAQDGPVHAFDKAAPAVAAVAVVALGGRDLVVLHTSRRGGEQVEHHPYVKAHLDMVEQQLRDQRAALEDRLLDRHQPGAGADASARRRQLREWIGQGDPHPQKGDWSKELRGLLSDREKLLKQAAAAHPGERAELERLDMLAETLGKCGEIGALDEAARILTSWMRPEDVAAGRDWALLDEAFQDVTFHAVTVGAHGADVIAEHQSVPGGRPHKEQMDACPNCASVLTAMGGHEPGRGGLDWVDERILQRAGVYVDTGHAPVPDIGARPAGDVVAAETHGDGMEDSHGDPGVLREGLGGQQDGALPLGRTPGGAGRGADPGEGGVQTAGSGGAADRPAHGGGAQDRGAEAARRDLAGPGHDSELIPPAADDGARRGFGSGDGHEAGTAAPGHAGEPARATDRVHRDDIERVTHLVEPSHRVDPALAHDVRPEDHYSIGEQLDWAHRLYEAVRANPHDVEAIVQHLSEVPREDGGAGYSRAEIEAVREHLFVNEHEFDDGHGRTVTARFDEDPEIAQAWQRLSTGRAEPSDLLLLDHELAETAFHQEHPDAGHEAAHEHANEVAPWESTLVGDERRALYDGFTREGSDAPMPAEHSRPFTSGGTSEPVPGRDGPARHGDLPFEPTPDFEAHIGAHLLKDPAVRAAVRDALTRMREVLRVINAHDPAAEDAFFHDDPRNSGQVGHGVALDDLLAEGNIRELMTAYYNASFIVESPRDFVHSILRLAATGTEGWRTMRAAGLDTGRLSGYLAFVAEVKGLDPENPASYAQIRSRDFTWKEHLATYFGEGDEAARATGVDSLRVKRPAEAVDTFRNTPGQLSRIGQGLGRFEKAFLTAALGRAPEDTTPLPWRTGRSFFVPDPNTEWYQRVVDELGMPAISGPAGTASRLLIINELINPGADQGPFLKAVTGWLLTGYDHSSFEIVQALRGVGYSRHGAPVELNHLMDVYRSVPGLEMTDWRVPEFPRTLPDDHPLFQVTRDIDTPERVAFREGLIEGALADARPPEDGRPVLYLMGGGVASGKSFLRRMLQETGAIPKENVAYLDPDAFKEEIPEYRQIIAAGDSRASTPVQDESGILYGRARTEAFNRGINVICDVTSGNPAGTLGTIARAREAGYEVRMYGVTADPEVAVVRNWERATETGRYVPIQALLSTHKGYSEGFRAYADAADRIELYDTTDGGAPRLIAAKPTGGELEIRDERAFAAFEHKTGIDPAADGPEGLYPGDRAAPGAADHPAPAAGAGQGADPGHHTTDPAHPAADPGHHPAEVPAAPAPALHDVLGAAYTAHEIRGAITERARETAHDNGTTPDAEIQRFVLQRAVSRIFAQEPDAWLLKGGLSFLTRFPDARPTTDLDFIRVAEGDKEQMAADYNAALARDHGDGLRFEYVSSVPVARGKGIRIEHIVYLGDEEIMPLSVDLVPNRVVEGYPESETLWRGEDRSFPDQLFRFEGPDEPRDVRILSLEGFLRQKIAAMYTYDDTDGGLPTRPNDMVDLVLVALKTSWPGPETHAALRQEFEIRYAEGKPVHPVEKFSLPNPAWTAVFEKRAQTIPGMPFTVLPEALPLLEKFLDPLLGPEAPHADWDHTRLEWVPRDRPEQPPAAAEHPGDLVAPLTRTVPVEPGALDPAVVKLLPGTGDGPPSTVFAEPERIPRWDALSGRGEQSLAARVAEVATDPALGDLEARLDVIRENLLPDSAGAPSRIADGDAKNLRFYGYQAGELFIHSSALMTNPDTTIEVGYRQDQVYKAYAKEAQAKQITYSGELPEGMTPEQAAAVALWRSVKGLPVAGLAPAELVHDLLAMHAQPLGDALSMRDKMIGEFGIAPERIRLVYADPSYPGGGSRTTRAHLFTLDALRSDPDQVREKMVAAMTGTGTRGEQRLARAEAVVDRIDAAAAALGRPADKLTLLWVRDQRANPTANRNGLDAQPGTLRQLIETSRAEYPDRHIVLVGDDVFLNRPGLRDSWEREGVLDGVDTTTMVKFWNAAANGGEALGAGEQGLVFHKLVSERDVLQIGTESGALEIPFLLGVPTVYLENLVFHLNKGNRWLLMEQPWRRGSFDVLRDPAGGVKLDAAGHAVRTFETVGEPLPPPLPTVRRVQFGPDLAVPRDRQTVPKDFPQQRVALTADRLYRLVESGELDRWSDRLGWSTPEDAEPGAAPAAWTAGQWKRSEYYADQLQRWLNVDATPENVAEKWDAVRLALRGVLDPDFKTDPEVPVDTLLHPYFVRHTDGALPPGAAERLERAFDTAPEERGAAVVAVLKSLLGDPALRERAVRDELLFALSEAELGDLRAAVAQVLGAAGRGEASQGADEGRAPGSGS